MSERIVSILGRLRARLLLVRSAEAAAVGAATGGAVAALLMAGRILVDVHAIAAAALSCVPVVAGVVLALVGPLRRRISTSAMLQWYVVALAVASGLAGAAWALSGAGVFAGKNWLIILAPAGALAAAAIVVTRGASLAEVAVTVDRRADLKERLATALELSEAGDDSTFGGQVRRQVVAVADGRLRRVRFWRRTRATAGAACLALLAAALMLPWDAIESDATRQRRQWARLAPEAARRIEETLVGLDADAGGLGGEIAKIEAAAEMLRGARIVDAGNWRGKVVELDKLAEALRRIVRSGQADAVTARRLKDLIRAIDEASATLADGMSAGAHLAQRRPVDPATLPAVTPSEPTGWTRVYNPAYADLARSRPADGSPAAADDPPVVMPFDRQWREARLRAADRLRRQAVPAQHRQLVRDFFARQ